MSSTASAFGIQPAYHPSGSIRQEAGTILTGYATSILQNAPVRIATDGSLEIAAVAARAVGVFSGVEYTDTAGRRQISNQWTANLAATDIVAYYTRDPAIVYRVQSDAALNLMQQVLAILFYYHLELYDVEIAYVPSLSTFELVTPPMRVCASSASSRARTMLGATPTSTCTSSLPNIKT